MKITVFGATGLAGKMVVQKALEKGFAVTAYARNPSKIGFSHPNLTIVTGKLAEPETIDATVKDADCVISLLGPTTKTRGLVIADATKCILRSMKQHGVKRLIATSTPSFKTEDDRFHFVFDVGALLVKYFVPDGHKNIVETGKVISESELDWTILRLPFLNNNPATGIVKTGFLGNKNLRLSGLSRADLSDFLVNQIEDKTWIRKAPVISG